MDLHQIQLTYRQDEDRILLQASFKGTDGSLQEIRAWLTRRMVNLLWAALMQSLETRVTMEKPQAAHAKSELVGMEHQESIATMKNNGNLSAAYDAGVTAYPLGESPLLISDARITIAAGKPIKIHFTRADKVGFEVGLVQSLLHGFCMLLIDAVNRADWGLDLKLPGTEPPAATGRVLN